MVTSMLDKALEQIPDGTNLILHSDQGWQYQHKQYQQILKNKGVQQSMSRKGNCLDNAVIENFFGLLKSELFYLQEFKSMEHFRQELIEARGGLSFISQLTLLHFCDTFPALLRGNFNAASGMIQTRLIHNPKYFKKEGNIP